MSRVRSAVARANKRLTVQVAAILLSASMLLSTVLGLIRDRFLNTAYMPNEAAGLAGYPIGLDAYTAAFTVPDFMFTILVSGALSVTFIPVFNQRLGKGNKHSAWQIGTSMINFMALLTVVASILIIIFADPLIRYVIAPGLNEAGHALAVSMMRVIAVNPFLFAVATVIASMQQAIGRFTFYAMAPAIYNIGIIIGIMYFTGGVNLFGWQIFDGGIMGVALGVVLGSVMQLIVSAVGLIGLGFDYQFKIYWRNKGFRKILSLLPARSVDQGMDYAVSLVETNLASRFAEGTIRAYQQALTLHMVPISLIGVAISNAAFPGLTERLSEGRPDLFRKELQNILRVIVWLTLPVAVVAFFTRGYLVHFLFNDGQPIVANILACLVLAILFRSIYHIAARAFYAQQDTKTPLYISFFSIGLNVILAIWLSLYFDNGELGVYGLAVAQSIVALVEVVILFVVMQRRIRNLFTLQFMHAIGRMILATGIAAIVCYIGVRFFPLRDTDNSFLSAFPKFAAITLMTAGAYLGACKLFQLREADPVLKRLSQILFSRFGTTRRP